MYNKKSPQLTFTDFIHPFGETLSRNNRWVKLAELVPWDEAEKIYADKFTLHRGAPAYPVRMALGALIIKEKLGITDRETVEQITENPYLQYFIGLAKYQHDAPFDHSLMTHFRKRLDYENLAKLNDVMHEKHKVNQEADNDDSDSDTIDNEPPSNKGKLIVDATCAPSDIRYPTDMDLLNTAREKSEEIIDTLYNKSNLEVKPRTYRKKARKDYLAVAKQRKPSKKTIRKGIRKQLNYLRRNIKIIEHLSLLVSLKVLSKRKYKNLLVLNELYRQQEEMFREKKHSVSDRIVSLSQPFVRPIVRGKAATPTEFGAKLSISVVDGYIFLDRISFDNYNESKDLISQIDAYYNKFGYYPKSVHADKIYRTRANLSYCKTKGIRFSGKPLGRPLKDSDKQKELDILARHDGKIRNEVESKFGIGKRRYSLDGNLAKLSGTTKTWISITLFVMNLDAICRKRHRFIFFYKNSQSIFMLFSHFFLQKCNVLKKV